MNPTRDGSLRVRRSHVFDALPDATTSVGYRLRTAREDLGWSIEEACDWIGVTQVSPRRLTDFELNRVLPTSGLLSRIAEAYQIRFGWLVFGDGPMKRPTVGIRKPRK